MVVFRILFLIFDILFGVLDCLFKDNVIGKVFVFWVVVVIFLFIMVIVWYRGDSFFEYYK